MKGPARVARGVGGSGTLGALTLLWAMSAAAQSAMPELLEPIEVTGRKVAPDELLSRELAHALEGNPDLLDTHITVTTQNGVVTLHGVALDYLDVMRMKLAARRLPGVKRVVDDIEVLFGGE